MKFEEIEKIIQLLDQTSIKEFKYEAEGVKVKIKKHFQEEVALQTVQPTIHVASPAPAAVLENAPVQPVAQPTKQEDKSLHLITSPMVGTFYSAPNPTSPKFVVEGAKVNGKSIVCILEAMKLFNEIEAEVDGEIVEVLVQDGQLVEFGQPLFSVKKN